MPAGRRSKLTQEVHDGIIHFTAAGNYPEECAKLFDISPKTLARWRQVGRKFPDSIYGRFRTALIAAEQKAQLEAVERLYKTAMDEEAPDSEDLWRWLERKFPGRWSRDRYAIAILRREVAQLRKEIQRDREAQAGA